MKRNTHPTIRPRDMYCDAFWSTQHNLYYMIRSIRLIKGGVNNPNHHAKTKIMKKQHVTIITFDVLTENLSTGEYAVCRPREMLLSEFKDLLSLLIPVHKTSPTYKLLSMLLL